MPAVVATVLATEHPTEITAGGRIMVRLVLISDVTYCCPFKRHWQSFHSAPALHHSCTQCASQLIFSWYFSDAWYILSCFCITKYYAIIYLYSVSLMCWWVKCFPAFCSMQSFQTNLETETQYDPIIIPPSDWLCCMLCFRHIELWRTDSWGKSLLTCSFCWFYAFLEILPC